MEIDNHIELMNLAIEQVKLNFTKKELFGP
jgi:hypothetical protein